MNTFFKYHLREYLFYTFAFFIIFSGIITLVQGIIKLQDILDFNPSFEIIIKFFVLVYFQLLSFIYTLSAFMGVLFAIHRFKFEKEVLAFYSLGFSLKDFLKPLLIFSLVSLIITFLMHFFLLPWAKRNIKLIQISLIKAQIENPFVEKRPVSLGKEYYLYVLKSKKEDQTQIFKNIFLLERTQEGKRGFFISQNGSYSLKDNLFTLIKGWGIFIDPQNNIEVLKFENYKFRLEKRNLEEGFYFKRGEKSFSELREDLRKIKPGTSQYFRYLKEYYQRFFFPLSAFFLVFQAFFLGIYIKTSHRFFLFFIGVAVFLIFNITYSFFSSLGENGKIFPLWSFLIFYLIISFLLIFQFFAFKKLKEAYL